MVRGKTGSMRVLRARGAVLIVGLVTLLVITLFGLSAMQATVLQERMAGNLQQNHLALQAAEAGVQAGIAYLERQDVPPVPDATGSNGVWTGCSPERSVDPDACSRYAEVLENWRSAPPDTAAGAPYTAYLDEGLGDDMRDGAAAPPRVYIESRYMPPLDAEAHAVGRGRHYYAVTAVGYGPTADRVAIVRSSITKVYAY